MGKKKYEAPKMQDHGRLRELTKGGGTGAKDPGPGKLKTKTTGGS